MAPLIAVLDVVSTAILGGVAAENVLISRAVFVRRLN